MGLITGLLTLPLAPVRGVAWVAEQVAEEAEREMNDETRIKRQLAALQWELDEGRIAEDEYDRLEDELLDRLERSRS
jgi:hypothetical protein